MSTYIPDNRKVTTHRLVEMKQRGEKISMLTSYDYSFARIVDEAGIDVILVGDSASNVIAGNVTTLPMTLDQMIFLGKSVVRGAKRALVVVDMPFGTYQGNSKEALASAIRIMKETHCDCVKVEGGEEIIESIKRILTAGIPVMGHLGLTPQSINKFGTYAVRAKEEAEANKLLEDAKQLEQAGCFAIVLEKIPAKLATRVAQELTIPIIGIGAGGGRRRPGTGRSRHAWHQQRVFAPLPTPLRLASRRHDRSGGCIRRRCEVERLPQCERTVLRILANNPLIV